MKLLLSVSLFALLLLSAPTLTHADQLNLTLQSVNGIHQGGYYVGPATGILNNLTTGDSKPIIIVCDDFANAVNIGWSWDVKAFSIEQLSSLRYGGQANAVNKYLAAFWLVDHFNVTPQNKWGDIQFAIWSLFNSNRSLSNAGATIFQNQALASIGSVNASRFRVLTPTGAVGQEMITPVPELAPEPVPEPVSMLLFGSGLMASAIAARRRRRRQLTEE